MHREEGYVIIKTIKGGKKATAQVWDGAEGLTWEIPSPAPYHTFTTPPHIPPESSPQHA
jgi:cytochrome c oxidase subunit 1